MAQKSNWLLAEFSVVDYRKTLQLQRALVDARAQGVLLQDVLLILEHRPVFTLGRRGSRAGLLVQEEFLRARGVEVIQVERGGDVTYHGPGQVVAYPIAHLPGNGWQVADFVHALEEIMIRTAAGCGVKADRNPANRGVWVGGRKLGSVGVAVRDDVSFHGLALNAATDLTPFTWIHPCGLTGCRMTSLREESGRDISIQKVREAVVLHAGTLFGASFLRVGPAELQDLTHVDAPAGPPRCLAQP